MPLRRMRARVGFCLLVLGAALGPAAARAQPAAGLDVTPNPIVFPTPGVADFFGGSVDRSVEITVSPGAVRGGHWNLFIRAEAPVFGGAPDKPAGDLSWRVDGAGEWIPLTTADRLVTAGTGKKTVSIDLRLRLAWHADPPGSPAIQIRFTALSP